MLLSAIWRKLRLEVGSALYPDPLAEPEPVLDVLRIDARLPFPSDKGLQVRKAVLPLIRDRVPGPAGKRFEAPNTIRGERRLRKQITLMRNPGSKPKVVLDVPLRGARVPLPVNERVQEGCARA